MGEIKFGILPFNPFIVGIIEPPFVDYLSTEAGVDIVTDSDTFIEVV